jgi:hypothetical protein
MINAVLIENVDTRGMKRNDEGVVRTRNMFGSTGRDGAIPLSAGTALIKRIVIRFLHQVMFSSAILPVLLLQLVPDFACTAGEAFASPSDNLAPVVHWRTGRDPATRCRTTLTTNC